MKSDSLQFRGFVLDEEHGCRDWSRVVKSRSGKEDQSERHRFDKTLVCATVLIGRRKRMWWRTASGRSVMRSMLWWSEMSSFSLQKESFFFLAAADLVSIDEWGIKVGFLDRSPDFFQWSLVVREMLELVALGLNSSKFSSGVRTRRSFEFVSKFELLIRDSIGKFI